MMLIFQVIICIVIAIYILSLNQQNFNNYEDLEITDTEEIVEEPEEKEKIKVHIAGSVVSEGIVELEEGARVADAIDQAGGTTADANMDQVNLAYKVQDGQKIYIPNINEEEYEITEDMEGIQNIYETNPDIINKWCEKYYSEAQLREQQKICRQRLFDICEKHGLIYDKSKIEEPKKASEYVEIPIYEEIMKHKENFKILGEFTESFGIFFRKGLANPESSYFMNHVEFRPPYKEVIDIIHKAGGKAFLAHPFEYKFDDTIGFIDSLRKEAELDGIECFHPSSEDDNKKDILVNYARKNNLFISGGSDYHGNPKPDIEIGIGRGKLNIPKEIIEEWK